MWKLTRAPTQTLPKRQQRSRFSSTLRTTPLSRKGAGPGDSAPSSFLLPLPQRQNRKPRGQRWKEPPGEEPVRKKRGRPMTKNLDLDPDPDPDPPSPDSPTETFAAPAEVRHFTDGSFPPPPGLRPPALLSHTAQGLRQQGLTQRRGRCRRRPSPARKPLSSSPSGASRDAGSPGYPRSVRMEEPPAVSLLQDWSKHPQGTKSVGGGDPPTGLWFCQSPAPPWGGSQRQGVACRFSLSWGRRGGGGGEREGGRRQGPPFGLSLRAAQLGHLMERLKPGAKAGWRRGWGAASIVTWGHWKMLTPGKAQGQALGRARLASGLSYGRALGLWRTPTPILLLTQTSPSPFLPPS
uniref:Uncharacterized protein n=1 Tax=Canis lupus familiaris TaxID=9615 RepID=A0A8C0RMB0_CANLF